jgi:hypothetical protein
MKLRTENNDKSQISSFKSFQISNFKWKMENGKWKMVLSPADCRLPTADCRLPTDKEALWIFS